MSIRMMMDAYNPNAIPKVGWNLLAGYMNGINTSQNYAQLRARFPDAEIASISTNNDPYAKADVADCERFDYTPQGLADWLVNQHAEGIRPTGYASRSDWPVVVAIIESRKVPRSEVDWWATTLDGNKGSLIRCTDGLFYTCVACQYGQILGGTVDVSEVYDDAWHPTGAPTPPPLPIPVKEENMITTTVDGKVTIFGEAVDNSDLLMFQLEPSGQWTVGDITQGVHNANPADPREYKIH